MANFFKSVGNVFKDIGGAIFGKDTSKENQAIGNEQQQKMYNALKSGQEEGRRKAQELYGTSYADVGQMAKGVTDATRKSTQQYSGAQDLIGRKANQQAKITKLRSGKMGAGSKGEQVQASQNMQNQVATNRFTQQQQSMDNYRSLVGNLARNMATTEMGQGQLNLSAIRPLSEFDMKQSQGILSNLF